jgi:ATP-dependent helicase/DNAse subunit B
LQAFGERQAQWAQAGWRISEVELEFGQRGHPAPVFPSEEDGLALTGKIDRLDQHPELGFVALDYKTAAKATPPMKAHRTSRGIWKDLQLPLYQVLLESIQINVPPTGLGYVNLPPNAEAGGFLLTNAWTEEDLLSARDKAAEVIEVIQSGGLLQVARESLA